MAPEKEEDSAGCDGRALGADKRSSERTELTAALADRKPLVSVFSGRHVDADAAAVMRSWVVELAQRAYAAQGPRAFLATQRAAALHEAGHVMIAAIEGRTIKRAYIKRRRLGDVKTWIGQTIYDGGGFFTSPKTSVALDWSNARLTIAGMVAELVFDSEDFREGSSIDEICEARIYVTNISVKTGIPATVVWIRLCTWVRAALVRREASVLETAASLVRRGTLRRADIEKIMRRQP